MRNDEDQLKAWMIAGLDGDASSHASLLRALVPALMDFYRRRLGGHKEIEDLVQETLIAVHTRRSSYDRDRRFTTGVFAIARYKMIDHFRLSRHSRHYCTVDNLDEVPAAENVEEDINARMDIDRLLGSLPAKQAAAIRRTRLDGLSVVEAGDAAGISESDTKISVHRGLKTLAARIKREAR